MADDLSKAFTFRLGFDASKFEAGVKGASGASSKLIKDFDNVAAAENKLAKSVGSDLPKKAKVGRKATDNLSSSARKLSEQIKQAAAKGKRGFDKLAKSARNTGPAFTSLGGIVRQFNTAILGIGSVAAIGSGLRSFTEEMMGVERATAEARTIFKGTDQQFKRTVKTIREIGAAAGFDAKKSIEAMYQALSNDVGSGEIIEFMRNQVKFTAGGFTDFETSVKATTTALNSLGIETSEVNEINGILLKIVDEGQVKLGDLNENLGKFTPAMKAAGVATKEGFAIYSALSQSLGGAELSATALSNLLKALSRPTTQARQEAARLGLSWGGAALRTKGVVGVLRDLKAKLKDATAAGEDQSEIVGKLIADARGYKAAMNLLQGGLEAAIRKQKEFSTASTKVSENFEKASDTVGFKAKVALETFKEGMIQIGEELLKTTNDLVEDLGGFENVAKGIKGTMNLVVGAVKIGLGSVIAQASPFIAIIQSIVLSLSEGVQWLIAFGRSAKALGHAIVGDFSNARIEMGKVFDIIVSAPERVAAGSKRITDGMEKRSKASMSLIKSSFSDLATGAVRVTEAMDGMNKGSSKAAGELKTTSAQIASTSSNLSQSARNFTSSAQTLSTKLGGVAASLVDSANKVREAFDHFKKIKPIATFKIPGAMSLEDLMRDATNGHLPGLSSLDTLMNNAVQESHNAIVDGVEKAYRDASGTISTKIQDLMLAGGDPETIQRLREQLAGLDEAMIGLNETSEKDMKAFTERLLGIATEVGKIDVRELSQSIGRNIERAVEFSPSPSRAVGDLFVDGVYRSQSRVSSAISSVFARAAGGVTIRDSSLRAGQFASKQQVQANLFSGGDAFQKATSISALARGVFGGAIGFNEGGLVPGQGSGDRVPAMLEPGEFVVNKRAAAAHMGMLAQINQREPSFSGFASQANTGAVSNSSSTLNIDRRSINNSKSVRMGDVVVNGQGDPRAIADQVVKQIERRAKLGLLRI